MLQKYPMAIVFEGLSFYMLRLQYINKKEVLYRFFDGIC